MKIANIIYNSEIINNKNVDYINYINAPIRYGIDELNYELPTLYVGRKFLKEVNQNSLVIQNSDVLSNVIIDKLLYWVCSYDEDKIKHVRNVKSFMINAPQIYFMNKYTIINIDPVFMNIKNLGDLLSVLPENIDGLYNYMNKYLYFLSGKNIYFLNLEMFQYFGFSVNNIITYIEVLSPKYFFDCSGSKYSELFLKYSGFNKLLSYVVVILLNNSKCVK